MKLKNFLLPLLLCVLFISALYGQDTNEQATPDSVRILPYAPSGISEAFSATNILLKESVSMRLSEEQILSFTSEEDTLFSEIKEYLSDSTIRTLEGISDRELDNISQRSTFFNNELERMEKRLAERAGQIEESLVLLNTAIRRWELTVETVPAGEMPRERLQRIDRSIIKLDSVRSILQADIGQVLVQQDRIAEQYIQLENLQQGIRLKKTELGESLARRDMPGFFKDLSTLNDPTLLQKHRDVLVNSLRTDREILNEEYLGDMVFALLMFLLLFTLAMRYKKHLPRFIRFYTLDLSDIHLAFVHVPGTTVLFLTTLLIRFLLPGLPHTFYALNILIMMLPMSILAIRIFGAQIRGWILVLVVLVGLVMIYEQAYYPTILLRILLLGISIASLWLFIWVYMKKPFQDKFVSKLMGKFFRLLILTFIVLLCIAIIANLVGAFRLAEFFTLLPVQIAVLAMGIQVATKLADTLIFLFLASNYVQKANVIRDEFARIYKKCTWLVDVLLWLFFFTATLNIFRVKEAVFEWGRGVLTNGIKLGNLDITLGNILLFIFVIWLSIMITRIVRSVLEKDVFTRVQMARGVPSTIILLVRIALIAGGFFLAAAVAGMELTNLSIVLGAFSVGIGFGLQNIFNNMVSGLILAFERPIKVGDVVQVGELMGTVRVIGLRSSTIKSFDGSEVIVPNGNLISDQMINWTLSDSNRRMDIRVGVAYGTDPQVVLELMEKIAREHAGVQQMPAPRAYFIEFGDSSLNFRLLAWAHLDKRLETESEIYVRINQKLAEAGIEIPFPQTDLHLRSDDTKSCNRTGL